MARTQRVGLSAKLPRMWRYKKRWLASQRALKRAELEIERLRRELELARRPGA